LTNSGAYVFPWHEFKHSRPLLKRELELFFRQNFRRSWHDRFLNIF
jgi:hypothetical protein